MKPTRCKICRTPYIKWSISQKCCSDPVCALALVKIEKEKRARKQHAADKIRLKSRREWVKDAQTAFNAWVRKRDEGKSCISCGTTADIQYCAGHYRTVGSCPELRFDPLNVHLQCNKNCNMEKSGNIIEYRKALIAKIGLDRVEWLEGPHEPKKYTIPELQEIQREFKQKLKELPCKLTTI